MSSKDLEESMLDSPSQASADLQEALDLASSDEQKDTLILEHIKKMCSQEKSVLDPSESAEWAWGVKDTTLHDYCTGRVTLVDFFTYCCINCQHVLPDLKDLENIYSPEDGFLVVGVHSAKFDTERNPESVRRAAKRMNITHPVLNDPQAVLWSRLGIHCWPTLLLLSPDGKPILVLAGEGHRNILFRCVAVAMIHFRKNQTTLKPLTGEFLKPSNAPSKMSVLSYPGKVCLNTYTNKAPGEPYLTISDSANNRVLIADSQNQILHIIGGTDAGFKDGSFKTAKFNNPQGMCWLDSNTLVVCDTGNHCIRKICVDTNKVELLAGTGVQGEFGDQGGMKYCQQALSSPWDIILYKTPDMDMSLRLPVPKKDEKGDTEKVSKTKENVTPNDDIRRVLLIAAAGSHQIWALFLDTTVWWQYRTFSEGTVIPIVGSGREENRNNRYPNAAGLAQPSGLALKRNLLFIADSESSTIRKLDLSSGQLYSLVGGDRNPCNLFAYGDIDGSGYSVRLQHPLGVATCPNTSNVYIADTYNHKIKIVDSISTECSIFYPPPTSARVHLSEPGGLSLTPDGKTMYVADTNSHRIVTVNVQTKEAKEIKFNFPDNKKPVRVSEDYKDKDLIISQSLIPVCSTKGSKLIVDFDCTVTTTEKSLHLTPQAPQRWNVKFHVAKDKKTDFLCDWDVAGCVRSGKELPGHFEATLKATHPETERIMRLEFMLSLCEGGLCFMRRFAVDLILGLKPDSPSVSKHSVKLTVLPNQTISLNVASL